MIGSLRTKICALIVCLQVFLILISSRVEESGADTLDPGVGGGLVQNRLRPLLRQQWGEAGPLTTAANLRGSRDALGETWVDGPALQDSWETATKASRRTAR